MFLSRNRRRSAKKVSKVEKQRDMELSTKLCKQKLITKSSSIAGSEAPRLNSEQRSGPNQNKSETNPVKQYDHTEAISSNAVESKASEELSNLNSEISCEEKVNRRTYSLEQVSRSLDEVMASGKAILDALASVNGTPFQSTQENTRASAKSCSDLPKRGTYSLEEISDLLDTSVNNNSVLEGNLNDLSQDSSKGDASNSNIKRGTYDLNEVSTKLDHSSEQNSSLEEILHDLSINTAQDDSSSSAKFKRGTYDLEKVEAVLDETLNTDENHASTTFNENESGTYDLSDPALQIDPNSTQSRSEQKTGVEQAGAGRRGTYNLSDVSDLLDDTANSGKSIGESLDQISSMDVKRKTYDLSQSSLDLPDQDIGENETARANENTQMNLVKNHHDNGSTDSGSNSEKRRTYVLDGSDDSMKLTENSSDCDTKPVDGVLSELGLDKEDGRQVSELTPGEWMEQMKGLKTPLPSSAASLSSTAPPSSATPTLSPLKLTLAAKKINVSGENNDAELSKNVFNVNKQRPQTIAKASSSTELNPQSDSETRARSMSDSKVRTQLKSHSSPNVSSNVSSANGFPCSESLKEISPGIQNYLANSLGLSNEQCMAVQRRLSSGSTTNDSKLANRKTYSLDDVAHSLDIATSQGLAMTKVLDKLDTSPSITHHETSLVDEKEERSSTNLNSSENQPVSSTTDPKPDSLDLESGSKAPTNRKTYIVANGSSFVESPTDKSPTIDNQFKLVRKKAVYKPSAKLQSFAHLLGGKGNQVPLRQSRGRTDPLKRNTYTLESVAESLEKAQDAGVPMLAALKRLSGSCQSDPSELSVEKRKTYDLEDLSNTLETAAAAGVPIADTLRTIADPDTDDVFTAEKPDEVAIAAPKPPPPKKKPPPKPKRTFSHASKPEIKFVSDSFVIEYYTSPPRRAQSEGSVRGGTPKSQGNYVNVCINENTLCDVNDGTSVPSSDKSEFLKDKDEMQTNNVKSPEIPYDTKPTTKVVSDLDSLLLKLAAEVQKPKHPDSSNNEPSLNSSTSNTEPELSSTKAENLSTKPDISNTKPDILNTNPDIVNTNPDILNTKPAILNTNANFSSTNRDVSSTKPDDEGYCSLSRKPGARSMKMKHESSDDLFKKEKLLTTFEKHTDMTDCKVEILRSFDNEGREIQEGVLELAPEHDTDDKTADSGEFSEGKAFDKGLVFYSV